MPREQVESESDRTVLKNYARGALEVEITNVSRERMGGVWPKKKLEAKPRLVSKNRETKMRLVKKEAIVLPDDDSLFGDERMGMSWARRYYERWRFLRKLKIPTASSMRLVDERHVMMGDMSVGGYVFFG